MIRLIDVRVDAATSPGGVAHTLLGPLSLDLSERRIAIIGANGSGKSTLLRLLNGLIVPTAGRVLVDERDTRTDGRAIRRSVGFTFTDPLNQLVLSTPLDDVELSLRSRIANRTERRARARSLLADHGLAAQAEQSIYDLSGGERQLAALVGVLAVEPGILVCDEPTTLLDLRHRERVARLLFGLPQRLVIATHDLDLAVRADRALMLADGVVAADGPPAEVVATYREVYR